MWAPKTPKTPPYTPKRPERPNVLNALNACSARNTQGLFYQILSWQQLQSHTLLWMSNS